MNHKNRLMYLKSLFFVLVPAILVFVFSFAAPILAQDTSTQNSDISETEISVDENSAAGYQFTADDKILLVEPAVCYITSSYRAYVFDPATSQWSEPYIYGPFGGTGFVVNPETGLIVTAGHMVDEVEANYVEMKNTILEQYIFETYPDDYYELTESDWNTIYNGFKVEGQNATDPDREVWIQFNTAIANVPGSPDESYIRAEVVKVSNRDLNDIAVLKVAPITGRALSSVILGDSSNVEISDSIVVIGYPWTSDIGQDNPLNPTVVKGSISGKPYVEGKSLLQIQAYAVAGNSGSPVLGEDGSVIGILTMGTDQTNSYLRPSNDIKILLGTENMIGLVDKEWRIGLAMYRQSHFSEAIKHFNAVLNLSAGHLLAQEYKAKAQTNIANDVPLVAATSETVTETTVPETVAVTTETTAGSVFALSLFGLNTTYSLLIIGAAVIIVILFIILLVLLFRRKPKKVAPDIIMTKGPVYIASPRPPTALNTGKKEESSNIDVIETTYQETEIKEETKEARKKEGKKKDSKSEAIEVIEAKKSGMTKKEAGKKKITDKGTVKPEKKVTNEPDAVPEAKPRFCPNCGESITEGQAFCASCGTKLK